MNDRNVEEEDFLRHLDSLGVPHELGTRPRHGLGLDRNTEEGALVAFASSLKPHRPWHRLVAWVLLVAFALPAWFLLLHLMGVLWESLSG